MERRHETNLASASKHVEKIPWAAVAQDAASENDQQRAAPMGGRPKIATSHRLENSAGGPLDRMLTPTRKLPTTAKG